MRVQFITSIIDDEQDSPPVYTEMKYLRFSEKLRCIRRVISIAATADNGVERGWSKEMDGVMLSTDSYIKVPRKLTFCTRDTLVGAGLYKGDPELDLKSVL